jgi:2-haloacid dehalogenase
MNARHVDPMDQPTGRRSILGLAAAATALPVLLQAGEAPAAAAPAATRGIKAMTFDIQGTLFDYHRPFIRTGTALGSRKGLHLDWPAILADWTAGAVSIIQAIIAGKRSWIPAGRVYREALDTLVTARGLDGDLDDADRLELMSVWGQMVPWPDSVEGIARLRRKVTVAALSNAGMATVIAVAKRGGLSFDAILTGELVHAYKPSPGVYQAASTFLGVLPGEIMMVAAHKFDLQAAEAAGFRTAYIPRPLETGPATRPDRSPETYIDIIADSVIELSDRMGVA